MPNAPLTRAEITFECLDVLINNLVMGRYVNRDYRSEFAVKGAKIGQSLSVRKPPRYVVGSGSTMVPQDYTDESVPVTLDRQRHIGLAFTSAELLLSIDDFSSRVIKPAIATLANQVDYDLLQLHKQINNFVGVPGTVPSTHSTYLDAGVALSNEAAPRTLRYCVVGPQMQATIVNAGLTFQNPSGNISKQYEDGLMGRALGFDWAEDQNIGSHTVGAIAGTPAIDGAQTGASILTKAWGAAATLKEGDKITIAGVYAVNPQSRESNGQLRRFTVTADVTADGAGAATIPVSPAIVTTGAQKNCTAAAANNALVSVWGAAAAGFSAIAGKVGPVGMTFQRDALALVTADLPLFEDSKMSRATDPDMGLSLRLWQQSDILSDKLYNRVDILYGVAVLRQELACVIAS